jgi:hypothetical protein
MQFAIINLDYQNLDDKILTADNSSLISSKKLIQKYTLLL